MRLMEKEIEALYTTFSIYPRNNAMEGSPLWEDLAKWKAELFSQPLRKLSSKELYNFAGEAILTWGMVEDYKHFLPRIMELVAQFDSPDELWLVLVRLNYGEWQSWPLAEIDAVKAYLEQLWKTVIRSEKISMDRLTDYLSAIGNVHSDFSQLLKHWEEDRSKASVYNLVTYFLEHQYLLLYKKKMPGFENSDERGQLLVEWIKTDQMIEKLEEAFFTYEEEDWSDDISLLLQLVEY